MYAVDGNAKLLWQESHCWLVIAQDTLSEGMNGSDSKQQYVKDTMLANV